MSSFKKFIKTGRLGKIGLYSSILEIENAIGKTDEILQIKDNMFIVNSQIFVYKVVRLL